MNGVLQLGHLRVDEAVLGEVCRRYHVKELAVFGSAARRESGPDSDVDVLVEFVPGARIGLIKFESLAEELEQVFGKSIDLVTKRGLKPRIRPNVLKDARVIYAA